MKLKFIEEKIANVLMVMATLLVFLFFASIVWTIAETGFPSLTWEMITSLPGGGFYLGKEGGILNAIVGSLMIVGGSTVLGLIISIPIVFYINVYLRKGSRLVYYTRLSFDVLFGIPSIVYGAFAFTFMIFLGRSEERRGGKEWPRPWRARWCAYRENQKDRK